MKRLFRINERVWFNEDYTQGWGTVALINGNETFPEYICGDDDIITVTKDSGGEIECSPDNVYQVAKDIEYSGETVVWNHRDDGEYPLYCPEKDEFCFSIEAVNNPGEPLCLKIYHKINDGPVIKDVSAAVKYLIGSVFDRNEMYREQLHALFLNKSGRVIGTYFASLGGRYATVIDTKLISKAALEALADGVIIAHNHCGDDPRPGKSDIAETEHLRKCLSIFGIQLLDHVILAEKEYFSFSEEKQEVIKA